MVGGRLAAVIGVVAVLGAATPARAGVGSLFGWLFPGPSDTALSQDEFASLLCIIGGASAGAATLVIGGAAIAVSGGSGVAAGTAVAVPVLVGTVAAACGVGTAAAPGILWLRRRSDALLRQLEPVLPTR